MLWGNHELCNVTGTYFTTSKYTTDFEETLGSLVDPEFREIYGSDNLTVRRFAFAPGGPLAEPLFSNLKVAVKVGRSVLVHAGLTTEIINKSKGKSIASINQEMREWVLQKWVIDWDLDELSEDQTEKAVSSPRDVMSSKQRERCLQRNFALRRAVPGHDYIHEALWMRDFSLNTTEDEYVVNKKLVTETLSVLYADRLVVGHTVQNRINSAFDDKVWRVDVGDGYPASQVLQIQKERAGTEKASVKTYSLSK